MQKAGKKYYELPKRSTNRAHKRSTLHTNEQLFTSLCRQPLTINDQILTVVVPPKFAKARHVRLTFRHSKSSTMVLFPSTTTPIPEPDQAKEPTASSTPSNDRHDWRQPPTTSSTTQVTMSTYRSQRPSTSREGSHLVRCRKHQIHPYRLASDPGLSGWCLPAP